MSIAIRSGQVPATWMIVVGLCLALASAFVPLPVSAQDNGLTVELRKLEQLRREKKYVAAETRIAELLRQVPDMDSAKRIRLQLELLKCKTASVFDQKPKQRKPAMEQLIGTADEFARMHAKDPDGVLLKVQAVLSMVDFGELIRKETEAGSQRSEDRQAGFVILRESGKRLEEVDRQLTQLIATRPRKTRDGSMNQRQLISLQNQVRYLKARAKMNIGLLYGDGDPDNRLAALTTAKQTLKNVMPLLETVDPTWWQARLDFVKCLRLTGDYPTAGNLLRSYPLADASPPIQLAARAERIRLLLAQNQLAEAETLVRAGRKLDNQVSPELDLAILEFYLKRKNVPQGNSTNVDLDGMVDFIKETHGTYWGNRAAQLLVDAHRGRTSTGTRTRIRMARELYRKKDIDGAIAEFRKASQAAGKDGNRKLALELLIQVQLLYRDRGEHDQVLKLANDAANKFRDQSRSAVANYLGLLSAAQLVREKKIPLDAYRELLDQHLQIWNEDSTIAQVARLRGDLELARRNYLRSAVDYRRALDQQLRLPGPMDLDLLEKNIEALTRCLGLLARSKTTNAQLQQFRKEFSATDFYSRLQEKTGELDSTLKCQTIHGLEFDESVLADALNRLERLHPQTGGLVPLWARAAIRLGKFERFAEFTDRVPTLPPTEIASLLDGLERDWRRCSSVGQKKIASLVNGINPPADLKRRHWKLIANCLETSGNLDGAIAWTRLMLGRSPESLDVHQQLARLLTRSRRIEDQKQGLKTWKTILYRVRRGTDDWFEAKLEVARAYRQLGEKDKAAALLKLLNSIPPGWSQSRWAPEFDQLFREIN